MHADDLYGLALEQFIPERGALAKALRADKRREEAAAVAALRKPSGAAWAVNQLVRSQLASVQALFAAVTSCATRRRGCWPAAATGACCGRRTSAKGQRSPPPPGPSSRRPRTAAPPATRRRPSSTRCDARQAASVADASQPTPHGHAVAAVESGSERRTREEPPEREVRTLPRQATRRSWTSTTRQRSARAGPVTNAPARPPRSLNAV